MSRFSIEPRCSHYIKKDQPRVGLFLSLDQLNDRARSVDLQSDVFEE